MFYSAFRHEFAFRQRVNLKKTELSFNQNVPRSIQYLIQNRMGVKSVRSTLVERSKKVIF